MTKPRFHRELLPLPFWYYSERLVKFKENRFKGKATACCPFHDDKHPSFSVNLTTGAYRCYSCGESGKDVLDFQMNYYRQDFKDAAKELGAWR